MIIKIHDTLALVRKIGADSTANEDLSQVTTSKDWFCFGLLAMTMPLAYADTAPVITYDPTKAQQPSQVQQLQPLLLQRPQLLQLV